MTITFTTYTFANGKQITTDNCGKQVEVATLTDTELAYWVERNGELVSVTTY